MAASGSGLTATVDGGSVTVTAARTIAAGTSQVTVTVGDATDDKDRQVSATFQFAVVAAPGAPLVSPASGTPMDGRVALV